MLFLFQCNLKIRLDEGKKLFDLLLHVNSSISRILIIQERIGVQITQFVEDRRAFRSLALLLLVRCLIHALMYLKSALQFHWVRWTPNEDLVCRLLPSGIVPQAIKGLLLLEEPIIFQAVLPVQYVAIVALTNVCQRRDFPKTPVLGLVHKILRYGTSWAPGRLAVRMGWCSSLGRNEWLDLEVQISTSRLTVYIDNLVPWCRAELHQIRKYRPRKKVAHNIGSISLNNRGGLGMKIAGVDTAIQRSQLALLS